MEIGKDSTSLCFLVSPTRRYIQRLNPSYSVFMAPLLTLFNQWLKMVANMANMDASKCLRFSNMFIFLLHSNQIWQRVRNVATCSESSSMFRIWQHVQNVATCSESGNTFRIWQHVQNLATCSESRKTFRI